MGRKAKLNLAPTGAGLANPFAALNLGGLPAGAAATTTSPSNPEPASSPPAKYGRVVLRREKAHRGGKTVIVIHDFAPTIGLARIGQLAAKLKTACGCGGTTRERTIEIQGD